MRRCGNHPWRGLGPLKTPYRMKRSHLQPGERNMQKRPSRTSEIRLAALVAALSTTTLIAEQLRLSPRTADAHVRSIYRKLEVTSRAAATRAAIEHQLI